MLKPAVTPTVLLACGCSNAGDIRATPLVADEAPYYGRVIGPERKIHSRVATAVAKALSDPTGAHLQAR